MSAKMFDHCEETGKYSFGIPETRCIYREATEDELRRFGELAEIESRFNYFRAFYSDTGAEMPLTDFVYNTTIVKVV